MQRRPTGSSPPSRGPWSGENRRGEEWSGVERSGEERRGEERRGEERSGEEWSGQDQAPRQQGGLPPCVEHTATAALSRAAAHDGGGAPALSRTPSLCLSLCLSVSLSLSLAPALSRPRPGGHGGALPAPRVSMNSTFESTCLDGSIRAKAHALKCKHIHPNGGTCIRSALPAPRVRYTRTVVNAHESTSNQVEAHPSAAHCPL